MFRMGFGLSSRPAVAERNECATVCATETGGVAIATAARLAEDDTE